MGFAAGLMNFAFDPDYARNGVFYTLHMESFTPAGETAAAPKADAVPGLNLAGYRTSPPLATPVVPNPGVAREMVVIEWTDRQIGNTTFEGTAREVLRMQLPGLFHPLNEITFNPAAQRGDPDWRVMYLGVGDSGTGERPGPMRLHAQRLDTLHGKILRIIPMLSEHTSTSTISANGYRVPNDNPFVSVEYARRVATRAAGTHGEFTGDVRVETLTEPPDRRRLPLFEACLAKPRRACEKQAIYAASRINQLRKSSSAASHVYKSNKISNLRVSARFVTSKWFAFSALAACEAVLDDFRNCLLGVLVEGEC